MLHPAIPHLLVPVYLACAWAWFLRVGECATLTSPSIDPLTTRPFRKAADYFTDIVTPDLRLAHPPAHPSFGASVFLDSVYSFEGPNRRHAFVGLGR